MDNNSKSGLKELLLREIGETATGFIENYPESAGTMKENPSEIEKRFHGVNPDYRERYK